jgi:hypothetical protein
MYRIKLGKVSVFKSNLYDFRPDLKFFIQKRYFFFFWFKIVQDGSYYCYNSHTEAETALQKYIQKLADNKLKKEHNKPTYYLVKDDKILSGASEKEVLKKKKLIVFA